MKIIAVFWNRGCSSDHGRQFKTVELRHAHVDENHRNIRLQQVLQGFPRRARLDQVRFQTAENGLVGEQLCGLIIDQQDVDRCRYSLIAFLRD